MHFSIFFNKGKAFMMCDKIMKKALFITEFIFLLFSLFFVGCDKDLGPFPEFESIIPVTFSIDIPDALSQDLPSLKNAEEIDTLPGDLMYRYLTSFIKVGETAAEYTERIIDLISTYQIDKPMILSYESDEDGRVKNLIVIENSEFEGTTWEFQMTITDADSEGNDDLGLGMQFFWNRDPVKGIAIVKPANLDYISNKHKKDPMYRIEYSEAGEFGYERHMIVTADSLPMLPASANNYAMKTLKMFAGKTGNIIDLYGNSVNPDAFFFTKEVGIGYNWAFVASANDAEDIGVVEVGLPKNDLDESSRAVLLDTCAMNKVLTYALRTSKPNMPPEVVDQQLANTKAPGYFDANGFVQAELRPDDRYAEIDVRLKDLCPYNPVDIRDLNIYFKAD
jgi:hypothetical protein